MLIKLYHEWLWTLLLLLLLCEWFHASTLFDTGATVFVRRQDSAIGCPLK